MVLIEVIPCPMIVIWAKRTGGWLVNCELDIMREKNERNKKCECCD